MAFKKTLTHRMFNMSKMTPPHSFHNCRTCSPSAAVKSTTSSNDGVFGRFLHRGPAYVSQGTFPELWSLSSGENMPEKFRYPADDVVRKLLMLSQLEMVKLKLRETGKSCVSYHEFVEMCKATSFGEDHCMEVAKMLDQSGTVIVLGKLVFLMPQQVMKAIKGLIPEPTPNQNEPKTKEELAEMEKQKELIDKKAESLVRKELWCGLGYLLIQTAAFMRLTFWELSWDVMEPICFYVTSMYFMAGYAFFLKTSKEPSFEGFFQGRFVAKQRRLMKVHNFDIEKYNSLRRACYGDAFRELEGPSSGTTLFGKFYAAR